MLRRMPASRLAASGPGPRRSGWRPGCGPAGSKPKARDSLLADERVVVDLGEAVRDQPCRAPRGGSGAPRSEGRNRGQRGGCMRDGVVADHAADLFDQVVLDGDVLGGAPARHGDGEARAGAVSRDAELEALEECRDFGFGSACGRASSLASPAAASIGGGAGPPALLQSARPPTRRMPGETSLQQLDGAGQAADGVVRVLRLSRSAWRRRCAASGARMSCGWSRPGSWRSRAPAGACWRGCRCRRPPMTPAMAMGPRSSAITRLRGIERVLLLVQRHDLLARARRAHEDGGAAQQVPVEGVHRLRELGHDVVGHVDDVVDRVQADGLEPRPAARAGTAAP